MSEIIDQGEIPVDDAVARIAATLDDSEEEQPQEAAEQQEEAPAEESEAEAQAETEEEAAPQEPEYEEITWNGEQKRLTKDELKSLAQQGFDYTQKTQQLAEARRQFDAQMQQAQQSFAIQNQQLDTIAEIKAIDGKLAQFQGVNWIQLAESDPVEYLKLNQAFRDMKDVRDAKVGEFQQKASQLTQLQTEHMRQFVAHEQEQLQGKLPEFKGEKADASRQALRTYLADNGFNDAEIGNVADHRHVMIAWKAMQYDKLKKSQPQVQKKVAEVPKVVKPGAKGNASAQASADLRAKLKKTGRGEYAAKLIENMI